MIELEIVRKMVRRGALLAPIAVVALFLVGQIEWAVSGAIGIFVTLVNFWLAGRVIGGLAENRPDLLQVAAIIALVMTMVLAGVVLVALKQVDSLDFRVAALSLLASHFVLVTWEASDRFLRLPPKQNNDSVSDAATKRS